jgi:hypothetical protein
MNMVLKVNDKQLSFKVCEKTKCIYVFFNHLYVCEIQECEFFVNIHWVEKIHQSVKVIIKCYCENIYTQKNVKETFNF